MNIKQRVNDLLMQPATTWQTIAHENTSSTYLVNMYLLPLLMLGSLATFLGFGIIGSNSSLRQGVIMAISYFLTTGGGIFLVAVALTKLAGFFTSITDFHTALKLIIYAFTPALAGSVINVLPSFIWLNTIFSLYGIYLLYLGLLALLKTPESKRALFTSVIVLCTLIIYSLLGSVVNKLLSIGFGGISYEVGA
jgi:hypothetical protein